MRRASPARSGVSFVIKFFMLRDYAPAPFMLELPDYKMPRAGSVAIGVYTRAKMFLQRAGTTIFSMMVLIWFLASFPLPPAGATDPAINYSFAAMIGKALEPLLAPIGFNWQIAVALIPGMAAREVAVAALGTVYAIEGGKEAADQIGQVLATKWSLATALSLLAWYIFAPQCASTLAVIRRETGSWKWMAITFAYMLALAYAREPRDLQHRLRPRRGVNSAHRDTTDSASSDSSSAGGITARPSLRNREAPTCSPSRRSAISQRMVASEPVTDRLGPRSTPIRIAPVTWVGTCAI